jgi:hypothetical protein
MTLFEKLKGCKTEEDVKDQYIKALGLKKVSKGLIDIQTDEVWFETKDGYRTSTYQMFTQLLRYAYRAYEKGEELPPFLAVADTQKAAIVKTDDVLPLLAKKNIPWGKSASKITPEALDIVSQYIGTYLVSFKIETHEEEFVRTLKEAIKSGEIIRTQITPDNLKQVFDKWVDMIGREIKGVSLDDYALLFFADIMTDGTNATHDNLPAELLHKGTAPVFSLGGKLYELGNKEGYRQFWAIYHRPPKSEYRNYLLERRDSLIPLDERSFKGAFYTPLNVVDKAYDKLTEVLGNNWQKDYIVWDMCCGVGNLEVKHSNPRNVYMSTLDQADVDVMHATKTCVAATRFQYDYLNDDITDAGTIDYSLTNKIPQKLRDAIKAKKKILVLMNPPYAEATSGDTVSGGENKTGVAKTKFATTAMNGWGKASNELFMQFLVRIAQEIPSATVATFSKLKYVTAPTLQEFRTLWNTSYLGGFVVDSRSFDGLKGSFPIGFLIWKSDMGSKKKMTTREISAEVLDKDVKPIGEKIFCAPVNEQLLTEWVERPLANQIDAVPLKNAVTPATASKDLRGTKWAEGAIAWLNAAGNDLQNAGLKTMIFSSGYGSGRGFFVTEQNLWKAAIIFSVRRLIKPTWLNDRDQFLQPDKPLSEEFKNDCLIWMLFNGSNLTASANDLEWNGKTWSIVNHFIPYTEEEVHATDRFESDFMVQYMKGKKFSKEAKDVLAAGKSLWQAYFANTDTHTVREELKLNRADVGWYQIRKALQARNESGDFAPVSFDTFHAAYKALTDKLQPMVYELGFLKG